MRRSATSGGFTLLEVMLALGILGIVLGFISQIWAKSMDKAIDAISERELREAGDTIFRRILYEQHKHEDGLERDLRDFYAEWCRFKGVEAERWERYRFRLSKKLKTAAGQTSNDDAEPLFGATDDDDDDSQPFGEPAPGEGENQHEGQLLYEISVDIWNADDGPDEIIMTLKTYIRPHDIGTGGP